MRYYDDPATTENEDDPQEREESSAGAITVGAIVALLFIFMFPSMIIAAILVATVIWSLLRYLRLRPSITTAIGLIVAAVGAVFSFITVRPSAIIRSASAALHDAPGIMGKIMGVWGAVMPTMWIGVLVGAIVGIILAFVTRGRMHKDPYLVQKSTEKYYRFRYRRTPMQALRRKRLIKGMKDDTYRPSRHDGDGFALGIEEEPINPPDDPADIRYDKPVCRMEDEVPTHTMITGQTGSGKTITMQNAIRHDMEKHKTMFIIDCKDDPRFAAKIAAWSSELGLPFYHFSPDMADEYRIHDNPAGPAFYDPLAHGNASVKTDMMISTREWDTAAAVYKSAAQSLLSTVFAVMQEMDPSSPKMANVDTSRGSMYTFYELIRNESNLISAIMTVPASSNVRALADELVTTLKTPRSREGENVRRAMSEYKSMLRGLMSSAGKYMRLSTDPERRNIDVFDLAAQPGQVVLFSLNATKPTDTGVTVGSMICTDLTNMTSSRANSGQTNPVSIYIDEFQSMPPTAVKSMMEKARSAGIGITLAFQSVQQVTAASGGSEAFIDALLDTCNNFIFHAGANESTAMKMSEIVGQHTVNDFTLQRRNQQGLFDINYRNRRNTNTQERTVDKYIVEPRVFQKLAAPSKANGYKSEAIVIKKSSSDPIDSGSSGAVAHKVWMIPPEKVVDDSDYFDPTSPVMGFNDGPIGSGLPDSAGESYDDGGDPSQAMVTAINNDVREHAAKRAVGAGGAVGTDDDDLFMDDGDEPLSRAVIGQYDDTPEERREPVREPRAPRGGPDAHSGHAGVRRHAPETGGGQSKGAKRVVSPLADAQDHDDGAGAHPVVRHSGGLPTRGRRG